MASGRSNYTRRHFVRGLWPQEGRNQTGRNGNGSRWCPQPGELYDRPGRQECRRAGIDGVGPGAGQEMRGSSGASGGGMAHYNSGNPVRIDALRSGVDWAGGRRRAGNLDPWREGGGRSRDRGSGRGKRNRGRGDVSRRHGARNEGSQWNAWLLNHGAEEDGAHVVRQDHHTINNYGNQQLHPISEAVQPFFSWPVNFNTTDGPRQGHDHNLYDVSIQPTVIRGQSNFYARGFSTSGRPAQEFRPQNTGYGMQHHHHHQMESTFYMAHNGRDSIQPLNSSIDHSDHLGAQQLHEELHANSQSELHTQPTTENQGLNEQTQEQVQEVGAHETGSTGSPRDEEDSPHHENHAPGLNPLAPEFQPMGYDLHGPLLEMHIQHNLSLGLSAEEFSSLKDVFVGNDISAEDLKELLHGDCLCPICCCPLEEEQHAKQLPCSDVHIFHSKCIWQWTRNVPTCPLCRFNLREKSLPVIRLSGEGTGTESGPQLSSGTTSQTTEQQDHIQRLHLLGEQLANTLQEGIEDDLNQLVLDQLNNSTSEDQRDVSNRITDGSSPSPPPLNYIDLVVNTGSTSSQLEEEVGQNSIEEEADDTSMGNASPNETSPGHSSHQSSGTEETGGFRGRWRRLLRWSESQAANRGTR